MPFPKQTDWFIDALYHHLAANFKDMEELASILQGLWNLPVFRALPLTNNTKLYILNIAATLQAIDSENNKVTEDGTIRNILGAWMIGVKYADDWGFFDIETFLDYRLSSCLSKYYSNPAELVAIERATLEKLGYHVESDPAYALGCIQNEALAHSNHTQLQLYRERLAELNCFFESSQQYWPISPELRRSLLVAIMSIGDMNSLQQFAAAKRQVDAFCLAKEPQDAGELSAFRSAEYHYKYNIYTVTSNFLCGLISKTEFLASIAAAQHEFLTKINSDTPEERIQSLDTLPDLVMTARAKEMVRDSLKFIVGGQNVVEHFEGIESADDLMLFDNIIHMTDKMVREFCRTNMNLRPEQLGHFRSYSKNILIKIATALANKSTLEGLSKSLDAVYTNSNFYSRGTSFFSLHNELKYKFLRSIARKRIASLSLIAPVVTEEAPHPRENIELVVAQLAVLKKLSVSLANSLDISTEQRLLDAVRGMTDIARLQRIAGVIDGIEGECTKQLADIKDSAQQRRLFNQLAADYKEKVLLAIVKYAVVKEEAHPFENIDLVIVQLAVLKKVIVLLANKVDVSAVKRLLNTVRGITDIARLQRIFGFINGIEIKCKELVADIKDDEQRKSFSLFDVLSVVIKHVVRKVEEHPWENVDLAVAQLAVLNKLSAFFSDKKDDLSRQQAQSLFQIVCDMKVIAQLKYIDDVIDGIERECAEQASNIVDEQQRNLFNQFAVDYKKKVFVAIVEHVATNEEAHSYENIELVAQLAKKMFVTIVEQVVTTQENEHTWKNIDLVDAQLAVLNKFVNNGSRLSEMQKQSLLQTVCSITDMARFGQVSGVIVGIERECVEQASNIADEEQRILFSQFAVDYKKKAFIAIVEHAASQAEEHPWKNTVLAIAQLAVLKEVSVSLANSGNNFSDDAKQSLLQSIFAITDVGQLQRLARVIEHVTTKCERITQSFRGDSLNEINQQVDRYKKTVYQASADFLSNNKAEDCYIQEIDQAHEQAGKALNVTAHPWLKNFFAGLGNAILLLVGVGIYHVSRRAIHGSCWFFFDTEAHVNFKHMHTGVRHEMVDPPPSVWSRCFGRGQ